MTFPDKAIFKSKTAFAASLTTIAGALGTYSPEVNQILATHASAILLVLGILNLVLRKVTRGRIVLFPS